MPEVQNRAVVAIIDTVPRVHDSHRRHNALVFAQAHATNPDTRNRAAAMLGAPQGPLPGAAPAPVAAASAPLLPQPRRAPLTAPRFDNV